MNPTHPKRSQYYDVGQTAYVLFKTSEARTRPTRVYTNFGVFADVKIGTVVNLIDDQTCRTLGYYRVVGIHNFASGETAGDVPDINLAHCVAK